MFFVCTTGSCTLAKVTISNQTIKLNGLFFFLVACIKVPRNRGFLFAVVWKLDLEVSVASPNTHMRCFESAKCFESYCLLNVLANP